MNKIIFISLALFLLIGNKNSNAQAPGCGATVPYFIVDMTGNPDSTWVSPNISRNGQCCGAASNERCISFDLILDSNSAGIQIDLVGADPAGSLFYDINCVGNYPGGTLKCISGTALQTITFCKPGANKNIYIIKSIPKPIFPDTDSVRVGCGKDLKVYGLVESSIKWNSVFPGTPGQHNNYLTCISCSNPNFNSDTAAPAYIDYEICGTPIASLCGYVGTTCDTVRVYSFDPLAVTFSPDPAKFCDLGPGSGVNVTATASGGDGNYSYVWLDSLNNFLGTGNTYFTDYKGNYSVEISDGLTNLICPSETFPLYVDKGDVPVVDAGTYDKICAVNPNIILQGTITNVSSAYWSNGTGTFSPDSNSLLASYTPSVTEVSNGFVKLYLTSVSNGCPSVTDSTTIIITDSVKVNIPDTSLSCNNDVASLVPTITGGTAPYAHFWSNGSIANSITVGEGTYSVFITDSVGCTASGVGTVTEPPVITSSISSTDATTNGGSDGTATVSPSGGTPGYTYLWSPSGQTTTVASGLSYGIHTVSITDSKGCSSNASVVVNEPRCSGFTSTTNQSNNICFSDTLGEAISNPTGGTFPYSYLWSNGDTTMVSSNLGANTYTVTVTDFNGCIDIQSVTITEPSKLNNIITRTDATTIGGDEGSALANPSGGSPGYTYSWSTGDNTALTDSLIAGVYYITLTDINLCTRIDSVKINQPPCNNFILGINKTDVSCFNGSNGEAEVFVLNGVAPYVINWSNGQTGARDTNLTAGTYTVNLTDSRGCTNFGNIDINEPPLLSLGLAKTDISCFGIDDGTIDATISGGTLPYTYMWSNNKVTQDIDLLNSGKYILTLTDANNCITIDSTTIIEPSDITSSYTATNITCNQGTDGAIDLTISGGVLPYSFNWSSGQTTEDISGVVSGGYSVSVSDGNNCTLSQPIIVGLLEPDSIQIDSSFVHCPLPGEDTTLVELFPVGGNGGPYQISFNNGVTYETLGNYNFNLKTDTSYAIIARDTNLCVSRTPNTINIDAKVMIDSITYNACAASNNINTIIVYPNGGKNGNYQISTDNGATFNTYGMYTFNLTAGNGYNIIVRDSVGCISATDSIFVSDSLVVNTVITSNYNGQDISCFGLSDAIVSSSITGGESNFTYNWSNGTNNDSLINVIAGTYKLIVTDVNGCIDSSSITITEPTPLVKSTSVISDFNGQDISCFGMNDGMALITSSGGNGMHTYAWSNATTNDSLMNVTAGKYYVTITDSNGCNTTDSITITEPSDLNLTKATSVISDFNGQDISCFGMSDGMALVTSAGGNGMHTYLWSNATTNDSLMNVTAGKYYVTVTDSNGCNTMDSITITEPSDLTKATSVISDFNGQDISCFGMSDGMALVTSSGGIGAHTYAWSNATTNDSLMNVTAGKYYVTITDSNGCNTTDSITITEPTDLTKATSVISDFNGQDISCFGISDGMALVTSSGGIGAHTYAWSNATTNDSLMNVMPGKHNVTITDSNGCIAYDSIIISEPLDIYKSTSVISDYNGQDISCFGMNDGMALITSSGGNGMHTYAWSNATTNDSLMNVTIGTYYVTVTDSNGCSAIDSVTITEPTSIDKFTSVISDFNGQNISCFGINDGMALVTSLGGNGMHTYAWSNATTNDSLMNVIAGKYYVTITDSNGCNTIDSVTINQPDSISISFTSTNVSCNGGNDASIDLLFTGGTPGYSYSWNGPGQFTATTEDLISIAAGVYVITITDTNECTQQKIDVIVDPSAIALDFTDLQNVKCYDGTDGSIDLDASGGTPGYTYSWTSNNNFTFIDSTQEDQANLPVGIYTVVVTDSNLCYTSISGLIIQPDSLVLTPTINTISCYGSQNGSINVIASGGVMPYSYTWNNGDTLSSTSNLDTGFFTVIVLDSNNCSISESYFVSQPDSLTLNLFSPVLSNGYNISYYQGEDGEIDATVTGGTTSYSYSWSNGESTSDIFNLKEGKYILTVTDPNNCTITDSITILAPLELEMPTGYTPNTDGSNDLFVIRGIEAYPNNNLSVFNRWGDLVYQKDNYLNTWDGNGKNNTKLPDGTYFAILKIKDTDITLKGYVDLRR